MSATIKARLLRVTEEFEVDGYASPFSPGSLLYCSNTFSLGRGQIARICPVKGEKCDKATTVFTKSLRQVSRVVPWSLDLRMEHVVQTCPTMVVTDTVDAVTDDFMKEGVLTLSLKDALQYTSEAGLPRQVIFLLDGCSWDVAAIAPLFTNYDWCRVIYLKDTIEEIRQLAEKAETVQETYRSWPDPLPDHWWCGLYAFSKPAYSYFWDPDFPSEISYDVRKKVIGKKQDEQ